MSVVKAILNLIYQLFMAFPRFFKPFLSAIPYIGTILQFLPEIVSLVKTLSNLLDKGHNKLELKYRLKAVDRGLANPDRMEAAREVREAITFK